MKCSCEDDIRMLEIFYYEVYFFWVVKLFIKEIEIFGNLSK